jgi:hypothetical protein
MNAVKIISMKIIQKKRGSFNIKPAKNPVIKPTKEEDLVENSDENIEKNDPVHLDDPKKNDPVIIDNPPPTKPKEPKKL